MGTSLSTQLENAIVHNYFCGKSKRSLLERVVGFELTKASWNVDLVDPCLTLTVDNGSHKFFVQLLGTYAHHDGEWLWAWANEQSNLPPGCLMAANGLRALGDEAEIEELTTRKIILAPEQLNDLGIAFGGMLGRDADAFFLGNTGDGLSLGLLICQTGATSLEMAQNNDIIDTIASGGVRFEQLRDAISSYFFCCGLDVSEEGDKLVGTSSDGRSVTVTIDQENLALSIGASLANSH